MDNRWCGGKLSYCICPIKGKSQFSTIQPTTLIFYFGYNTNNIVVIAKCLGIIAYAFWIVCTINSPDSPLTWHSGQFRSGVPYCWSKWLLTERMNANESTVMLLLKCSWYNQRGSKGNYLKGVLKALVKCYFQMLASPNEQLWDQKIILGETVLNTS